jgi:hypothetical protein
MNQNKNAKYLKYAIGEIVLVVIGILIALSINNWNEGRKNIELVKVYCQQLRDDLLIDLENLDFTKSRLNAVDEMGMYLLNFLNNKLEVVDTLKLKNSLLLSATAFAFSPNQLAYDDLIQSGSINLLKDKDLKKLLGEYYTVKSIEKENNDQRIRYSAELADSRFKHINPMMLREHLKRALDFEKETAIPLDSYYVNWEALKSDKDYILKLGRVLAIQIPQKAEMSWDEGQIHEILELMNNTILSK